MEKHVFEEHWPSHTEGYTFADKDALDQLKEGKTSWWKSVLLFVFLATCFLGFSGSDDPHIRTLFLAILLAFIYTRLNHVMKELRDLRREAELIKGAIRQNRYTSEVRSRNTSN